MTSKELTYRAIEFRGPPRLPMLHFNRDTEQSDVLSTGYAASPGFVPVLPGMTEWGYVWKQLDGTMGQPDNPPLADEKRLPAYTPPDPLVPGRVAHVALTGSREEIFAYVRRLRRALGRFNGGLIGYVEDYASLGMREENYQWIREAFQAT